MTRYLQAYFSIIWETIKEPVIFITKFLILGGWGPYYAWNTNKQFFLDHPRSDWFWIFTLEALMGWIITKFAWAVIKLFIRMHKNIHEQAIKKTSPSKTRMKRVKRTKRNKSIKMEQVKITPVEEILEQKTRLESAE